MKVRSCSALVLALITCALAAQVYGEKQKDNSQSGKQRSECPARAASRTYSVQDSGDTEEGPLCVRVRFNGLRYTVSLVNKVTVSAGANLSSVAPAQQVGGHEDQQPSKQLTKENDPLKPIQDALQKVEKDMEGYPARNDATAANLARSLATLKGLVESSDNLFAQGGVKAVLRARDSNDIQSALNLGENSSWMATDSFKVKLQDLQNQVIKLQATITDQTVLTQLQAIQTQITTDLNTIAPYLIGGDKTTDFYKQLGIFKYWDPIIRTLNEDDFYAERYIPCKIISNQSKQNAITVSGVDNLPRFDSQPVTALTTDGPVATVNCSSPFAVSAGVDFSFLKSPTFAIIPTGATGANEFGITDDGGVNPMPIAMAHWMLSDFNSHRTGLYGSFGVAAHAQSSAAGGSSAEYLGGFSLGFYRTVFVTAGWHLGKVSALSGGYKIGDAVPSGVTTVPVTSSYQSGFGLALSFTKP